jgi:dihydrofolate reductase
MADHEHHEYTRSLLVSAGFVLLGRGTFDLFEAFWPNAVLRRDLPSHIIDFARELTEKPKYILSNRDLDTHWNNVFLLRGSSLDSIRQLFSSTTERVVVFGSPSLGASLAAAGLVDELHLVLQPFIGVQQPRAYEGMQARKALSLLESRAFASGAIVLRYASA